MTTGTENLATATTLLQDNPSKTLDATALRSPSQIVSRIPPSSPSIVNSDADALKKDGEDSKSGKGTAVGSRSGDTAPVTDTEKKIRRAERFGITVQLSEEEKRNSRAERFGTGVELKTSEQLKKKARAERFGLPVTADEEARKKLDLRDLHQLLKQIHWKKRKGKQGISGLVF
ncbi:hypothetical protein GH714_027662 [Hevea brasiliensis]|uniref:THO1-MOS11 C-terminal domain-containing protein n=1 Tax=Hevea brasiliensis TaxID=3981 RepID=A0A6A6MFD9_HEVBR|nr:hypothetical protein GH714_027662 [Hevea brasiliensis]